MRQEGTKIFPQEAPLMHRFVPLLCMLIMANACIGSRHSVKLNQLDHAASMTAQIYGSDGKIRTDGVGLEVIGDIEISQRYWSLVYSYVSLGETTEQLKNFNNVVRTRGGQGVINFEVENGGCDLNNFAYVAVPAVLPFMPGCSMIIMRGKIVREVP
jgi:hypothetical protein